MNETSTASTASTEFLRKAEREKAASKEKSNFLILSALDFRTPRKASLHFIAEELGKRGTTRFFSLRYSKLSRYKADPRVDIDAAANRVEVFNGVECYLWKTMIHPFNTRRSLFKPVETLMYEWYRSTPPAILREWIAEADYIFIESGASPIFFDYIARTNPHAKTIYVASDDLATINVADFVHQCFNEAAPKMTSLCLSSRALATAMPESNNKFFVPHGIDMSIKDQADPNPYPNGTHAVSVGSMLFDPQFFVVASKSFPDVTFHIIGSGHPRHADYGDNVRVYDEMKFRDTLRYIKHAAFGIAPYSSAAVPAYLADTSMKLMQYGFFELPAVCPHSVVGTHENRFGYTPGDAESIRSAIASARRSKGVPRQTYLSWADVTNRLLMPGQFADTSM